ncbi:hypothetical protein [Halomicrobium mukohataei]|uniref:Uncharacterized protein n=2 Tax=Halomicrobium mukohataei TaxID=57705 RepID=C7P552_HALMD|nr:hypothetical protein [Halomicrobium mukohataei]ACV49447.1 hypothetical protein Hmuk_3361 [Halomicrobium mukohataei DSM 12286]QCD67270.1 hypothetical protein E5139_16665 [Halomicrobium mukohataei]
MFETRLGVALSKRGEDVTAIGKNVEYPSWTKLTDSEKQKILNNMPDEVSKGRVAQALNGKSMDLDVIANGNYVEAKNTPSTNSRVKPEKILDKYIRFKALQALGKAPDGQMIIRPSNIADKNNALSEVRNSKKINGINDIKIKSGEKANEFYLNDDVKNSLTSQKSDAKYLDSPSSKQINNAGLDNIENDNSVTHTDEVPNSRGKLQSARRSSVEPATGD